MIRTCNGQDRNLITPDGLTGSCGAVFDDMTRHVICPHHPILSAAARADLLEAFANPTLALGNVELRVRTGNGVLVQADMHSLGLLAAHGGLMHSDGSWRELINLHTPHGPADRFVMVEIRPIEPEPLDTATPIADSITPHPHHHHGVGPVCTQQHERPAAAPPAPAVIPFRRVPHDDDGFPRERYFTFGGGHQHPLTRRPLRDCYVMLEEDHVDGARTRMLEVFGAAWGAEYSADRFAPYLARWRPTRINLDGTDWTPDRPAECVAAAEVDEMLWGGPQPGSSLAERAELQASRARHPSTPTTEPEPAAGEPGCADTRCPECASAGRVPTAGVEHGGDVEASTIDPDPYRPMDGGDDE